MPRRAISAGIESAVVAPSHYPVRRGSQRNDPIRRVEEVRNERYAVVGISDSAVSTRDNYATTEERDGFEIVGEVAVLWQPIDQVSAGVNLAEFAYLDAQCSIPCHCHHVVAVRTRIAPMP